MFKKLIFLIVMAIFLTACGRSSDPAMDTKLDSSMNLTCGSAETFQEHDPGAGPQPEVPESTEPTACDVEYFLFTTTTNSVTDEDGLLLMYENQSRPSFSSLDPERSEWVAEILNGIDRDYAANSRNLSAYAREFIAQNGTEYFYSYSNYQQLGIARHDDKVVSLLSLSSLYAGGTHPNSVQTAWNLDLAGRRILRLEDVIIEGSAPRLAAMVRSCVDAKFNGLMLFEDYGSTIDGSMIGDAMTPYWYLNDKGLVIFYNQYELGPYAAGIIKAELPYGELEGILKEEYMPEPGNGIPGDLLLRGEWPGYHRIPITIEAEGERLLVGVEGLVYQVQLSEIDWLEDMPIARELIFSARTLCQNDVLEITGGFDDETRSFAIEFIDGLGQHRVYYLHVGALTEEP